MIKAKEEISDRQEFKLIKSDVYSRLGISRQAYSKWLKRQRQESYGEHIVFELLLERSREFPKEGSRSGI